MALDLNKPFTANVPQAERDDGWYTTLQQNLQELDSSSAEVLFFQNDTGSTLTKGTLVRLAGVDASTNLPTVIKADSGTRLFSPTEQATHIVMSDTSNGEQGTLVRTLELTNADTSGGVAGDPVYLGPVAGSWAVVPSTTNANQIVGYITKVGTTDGSVILLIETAVITSGGADITKEAEGIPGADDIRFSMQIVDEYGTSIPGVRPVLVWISDGAPQGIPTVSAVDNMTADTGTLVHELVSNGMGIFVTDSTGLLKVIFNFTGTGTKFVIGQSLSIFDLAEQSADWT